MASTFLKIAVLFATFCMVKTEYCEWRWNDGNYEYHCDGDEYDVELATGWIIAIAIISLIVVFGIPICICFCCGLLCFAGRNKAQGQVYATTVVQQQPGGMVNQGFQGASMPQPNNGQPMYPQQPGYVYNNYAQPPPYPPQAGGDISSAGGGATQNTNQAGWTNN